MIRLAVLNVFWFGLKPADDPLHVGFYHQPDDDDRVIALVAAAQVDVVTFVEIVDVSRLEELLKGLPGKWRVRDANDQPVCSQDIGAHSDNTQRVVVAWNDEVVELLRWERPIDASPRVPVVVRLRTRTSAFEITAVGIHPKSGVLRGWERLPPDSKDHKAGLRRLEYFEKVTDWVSNRPAAFAGACVVLGDFNSVKDSTEAESLRSLPGWKWPTPAFEPGTADRRTTRTDPEIIDHIVLSPGLHVTDHTVLAFDLMNSFPEPAHPSGVVWKRTTDHRLVKATVKA